MYKTRNLGNNIYRSFTSQHPNPNSNLYWIIKASQQLEDAPKVFWSILIIIARIIFSIQEAAIDRSGKRDFTYTQNS